MTKLQQVKKQFDAQISHILRDYNTGKIISKIESGGGITYTVKFPYLKEPDFPEELKSVFGNIFKQ